MVAQRLAVAPHLQYLPATIALLEPADALALEGYREWSSPAETAMRRLIAEDSDRPASACRLAQEALILAMTHSLPERLRRLALPNVFTDEYARCATRIVAAALEGKGWAGGMDDDRFRKDLALLALRMLPCVSHVVCRSGLPRRTLLRRINLRNGSTVRVLLALRGRLRPMLENHVHPDMLDRFDAHGRSTCYRLVAQLLRQRPQLMGLMGTSWYYDEAVGQVSPKLSYLRQVPADHGGIFLDAPNSADAIHSALARSQHRRALHEAGRYHPTNVTMVWPRRSLLASPFS